MSTATARLTVLAAAALFSTGGAAIKVEAFSAAEVSAMRSAVAAVVLVAWGRGRIDWSAGSWAAGTVYAATLTLFVLATKLTSAANAIFLQSAAPLYVLALAPFVVGERARPRDAAFVATAFAGVGLCFLGQPAPTSTAPDPRAGNVYAALSGLAWALTILALRRAARRVPDRAGAPGAAGLSLVVTGNILAAAAAAPAAWPLPAATAAEWASVAYLGVFQIALAYVLLTSAMPRLPALEVSLLLLLEPVLNPMWTWLLRGEVPSAWSLAGGAVIVAATGLRAVAAQRP